MEPLSPSNCWNCQSTRLTLPFCDDCGKIQELPASQNPFALLGEPTTLDFSAESLRDRYLGLSKKVHPDRFLSLSPRESLHAARWARALNQAYPTLKDPLARAELILATFGSGMPQKGAVPVELAEDYFEFQEILEEGGDSTPFLLRLAGHRTELQKKWDTLKGIQRWDEPKLKELGLLCTFQKYLTSMENDLQRRKLAAEDGR